MKKLQASGKRRAAEVVLGLSNEADIDYGGLASRSYSPGCGFVFTGRIMQASSFEHMKLPCKWEVHDLGWTFRANELRGLFCE